MFLEILYTVHIYLRIGYLVQGLVATSFGNLQDLALQDYI